MIRESKEPEIVIFTWKHEAYYNNIESECELRNNAKIITDSSNNNNYY